MDNIRYNKNLPEWWRFPTTQAMIDSKAHVTEIRKTNLNIAFFRSWAGVHWPQDNYYGIELGERVMAKVLPNRLARFGANKTEVTNLIDSYRIDWTKYIRA